MGPDGFGEGTEGETTSALLESPDMIDSSIYQSSKKMTQLISFMKLLWFSLITSAFSFCFQFSVAWFDLNFIKYFQLTHKSQTDDVGSTTDQVDHIKHISDVSFE